MKRLPNDEQQKVVDNLSENILLFAGAGTGKTFTVAHRVANILRQGAAKAEEILCLTFTIKAANEMREDIAGIVGSVADGVCVQTIHGFCYRLLKEEERMRGGRYAEPQVIDEVDEETLLQSIYLARLAEWRLTDAIEKYQLNTSFSVLKDTQVASYRGEMGWWIEEGFLTVSGVFQRIPAPILLQNTCNENKSVGDEESVFTAEEKPLLFIRKKAPMMGVVTAIVHIRAEKNLYSGEDKQDYQEAWNVLRQEKPDAYAQMLSYFKPFGASKGHPTTELDEEVERVLSAHIGDLIVEYEQMKALSNQLDFDDLILRTSRYLSEEETSQKYKNRYRYIIVDEMQDTSLTEYVLLKRLFQGNNVMMCGDFFQTIYGWRGSAPERVLTDFQKEFTPTMYAFKENYRSTQSLANASFGYLRNSYPKLLGSFLPKEISVHSEAEGEKILCFGFDNAKEEAAQIYAYVQKHRPQTPNDLCIMARSNSYIASLSGYFEKLNARQAKEEDKVRFFTVEKDHAFFKRSCVKDVLAVMKLLVNPTDRISMERIGNKYIRGVGAKTLESLRDLNTIGVSAATFLDENAIRSLDPYSALMEGAKTGKIVVYDTETTGLDLAKDEMVQISAVRLGAGGEIVDTLDLMVKSTVPIGQGAYETHGFDLKYIEEHGGVDAKTALTRFSEFVKDGVLVGHNSLRFDAPLVRRQLKEQGLPPLCVQGEFDTLVLSKQFLSNLPDHKLSTLCRHYGIVNEAAHNALGDITATAKVLWKMLSENIEPTSEERLQAVEKYAPKFEKFFGFYRELVDLLEQDRVSEIARRIVERMNLMKYYPMEGDREALKDVMDALSVAHIYDGESFLSSYLADAALSGSQMDVLLKRLQKVPIITVHQAKGCEFSTVILAGVSERFFPSAMSRGTPQEEEEKKVFYVAMTRAKERLIMTRVTADYHTGERIAASPYALKIPSEYVWTDGEF